jgi:hypothetical protein
MSALDKTYVNKLQYIIVRSWWIQNHDKMISELGYAQWLYPFDQFKYIHNANDLSEDFLNKNQEDILLFDNFDENEKYPLWNTSGEFDIWLMKNCNIDFIQNRLIEQYGKEHWGFKYKDKISFDKKSYLYSIHYNNNDLYLYDTEEDYAIPYNKIIVYGTTYIFKLLNMVENRLKGFEIDDADSLRIYFTFHGLPFIFRNGKYFIYDYNISDDKKEIEVEDFIFFNSLTDLFEIPNIKHSYELNDAKKYPDGSIILSRDDEVFNANHIAGFNTKNISSLNRYIKLQLDDYMQDVIS